MSDITREEDMALAQWVRDTVRIFPVLEKIHPDIATMGMQVPMIMKIVGDKDREESEVQMGFEYAKMMAKVSECSALGNLMRVEREIHRMKHGE